MAYTQDNQVGRLHSGLGKDALLIWSMNCVERLSEPFTITVDAFSAEPQPIHTMLGTGMTVTTDAAGSPYLNRFFNGVLWEYSELDADDRGYHYQLVLRPTTEFMTLNRRNRIFQNKSVVDIAKAVLIGDVDFRLNGAYAPLDYCVQYQESDFDFVSRLLQFEGIYYFYEHADGANKIVLVDDRNTHEELSPATVSVGPRIPGRDHAQLWSVSERRALGPTKVTVADYDFVAPTANLLKTRTAAKGTGSPTDRGWQSQPGTAGSWADTAEIFDFPAKFGSKTTAAGDRYSTVWLDAHRRRMARSFAEGTLFCAATGRSVTLAFDGTSAEYLILGTTHQYDGPSYDSGGGAEEFVVRLELMPVADQYRPALTTPRPRVLGPQTALVVGPSGEEIYTDEYGRIKVQFFWDREGKKDENSSCFIRVVQSGAGQGWGSFALPRIGQEVVVEFLDGDPDRPIVTGAVYNAGNTVPEALPANKTQFGMKSRITKGGGGFNRLWFEDKKDGEVVWFRAERDYKANIVNKDEERQYDKGSRKTTFLKGDDELVITEGKRTETIQQDDTRTVKQGNLLTTVETGDETLEVKKGNRSATVSMGNDALQVSMGNVSVKVDMGKHTTEAMQSIELTCGASKIKLDPTTISLEAMTVKINGQMMVETKGLMIQSEATAMQTIKGGLVMIN